MKVHHCDENSLTTLVEMYRYPSSAMENIVIEINYCIHFIILMKIHCGGLTVKMEGKSQKWKKQVGIKCTFFLRM